MMKSNIQKTILTLLWIILSFPLFSQEYIDWKIRTDDFYAKTDESGFGDFSYADPTWHFRGKVSSSSGSGTYPSYECFHLENHNPGGGWNTGQWYYTNTNEVWSGKCLDNADNIYIYLEGWEEQTGSPCTKNTNDDWKSDDTDYDTDISGSHTINAWTNFQRDNSGSYDFVDCGTVGNQGYYKVEFDVWWNWSEPVNPVFSITNITSSSLTINLTDKNQYRITDWDYQVSTNSTFTNIVASATEIVPLTTDVTNGLTQGTTYYIRIRGENEAGTGSYTTYQSTTTTIDQTTWDGFSWDYELPNSGVDAIISGNYTSSTAIDCDDLTIDNGITLNIVAGNSLTVNGNLLNNGTLFVESGGSLKTEGIITNNGTISIEQNISNGQWHMLSSPITNAVSGMFEGDFLQIWDETSALWNDISELNTPLTPVKGFGFWSNDGSTTYTFNGIPNTGEQSIAISISGSGGEYNKANLVGNPYPSSIDWDLVSGYGAKYTYNGTAYDSYINDIGIGSRYAAPGQGFFIVPDNSGNFTLNNSMRTHNGADGFVKSVNILNKGLVLSASNGIYEDKLTIAFSDKTSPYFELENDAYKLMSGTDGVSEIYSISENIKLSIDVRPETDIIQLGFQNKQNGNYSIGSQEIDGIAQAQLEDTKLNIFHDLSQGAYEFNWNTSDSEKRFILHLKATGTEELVEQGAQVYSHDGQVYIRQTSSMLFQSVQIFDLAGRVIYSGNLNQTEIQSIHLSNSKGAYLVQLNGDKMSQTKKVILN